MANKKNTLKKLKKRELKQLKNAVMAKCRRHASHSENAYPNSFYKDGEKLDIGFSEVLNTRTTQEDSMPEKPLLGNLENVGVAATKDDPPDRHNEDAISVAPARFDFTEENVDSISRTHIVESNLNNDEWFPPERDSTSNAKVYKQQRNVPQKRKIKKIETEDVNTYDAAERLIIDKYYFFEKLKIISNHAPQFGCTLSNLEIMGETKTGLNSKLKLVCNMCKAEFIVNTTDPQPTQNLDINTAAVSGITNAGIGLEQFQGLCAAMNLPTLTLHLYNKKHNEVCDQWEKTAHETMAAAAERERLAAIEEGRVKDGVAVIDVIADGCWSKRSYKSNYSALSGVAAIVGRKYREVIFMGVKNKYCCVCARAQSKEIPASEHRCFKNYAGSSSGMEAEIIAEGFKKSLEMYNIIYGRLIADGDSSTYSKILAERPYNNITVEKVECKNHVLRNLCTKLVGVSKDTKYPLSMRKMLTVHRILAIRKVICSAIKTHKNADAALGVRINNLHSDISNSYNHAFGHHVNCLNHYYSSEEKSNTTTLAPIVNLHLHAVHPAVTHEALTTG